MVKISEYIKPLNKRFQTVGFLNLFKKFLEYEYGKHSVDDLKDYIEIFPELELWCSQCGEAYSLEEFGENLDIEWRLKDDDSVGPMNITKKEHESYINPKQLNATCQNEKCFEYNLPLEYLLVGEPRTLAVINLEIWLLDKEKWETTPYLMGVECRNNPTSLKYLAENNLAIEKSFNLSDTWVNAYKLNKKGLDIKKKTEKVLFDNHSVFNQLKEFTEIRLNSLNEYIENYECLTMKKPKSKGQLKIDEYNSEDVNKLEILHIPEKNLEKIWNTDHKKYWGS